MLTIFAIPPEPEILTEGIRRRQQNAINSWCRLNPRCEIVLFGGGAYAAQLALLPAVRHIPDVARNEFGTPLVSDAFARAQAIAVGDTLMYSNFDMLYFDDLYSAVGAVPFGQFVLCGRRWDLEVTEEIALADDAGWHRLRQSCGTFGKPHRMSGMDFFIFPKGLRISMPAFVVGRPGWDSWLVYQMRATGVPVVDGSSAISAIHQNHDFSHLKLGANQYTGPEMQRNYALAGGYRHMLGLREADWVLKDGTVTRPPWPRRIFSILATHRGYRLALAGKRGLQQVTTGKRPAAIPRRAGETGDMSGRIPPPLMRQMSTTFPGTTEGIFRKTLERTSGLRAGTDFFLIFSPERECSGNPTSRLRTIPKLVGGFAAACTERACGLYARTVKEMVPVASCRVAEASKLFENIFRSVNIATAHRSVDYGELSQWANLIVDARNVMASVPSPDRGEAWKA